MNMSIAAGPDGYRELLEELKHRIRDARIQVALSMNAGLITLYWGIGREILERQEREGWGAKVVERLSQDLQAAFPAMKGFSTRNLVAMRDLAREWPEPAILPQLVARIPWGHNRVLLHKVKNRVEREWYARACIELGWSRRVLEVQIESALCRRTGRAVSNFGRTLPASQSDLAREALKDPYVFDFLSLPHAAHERDIERGLVHHIRDFLLELGQGFAFVGSQVPLVVGGEEFFVDLLFFHVKLRCYVVIELKRGAFEPEHTGKLNFYLSAVDELLRHPDDHPSIGLVLCRGRNEVVVEYALRGLSKPLGVCEYELTASLPEALRCQLPSVEQLEAELGRLADDV